MELQNLLQNLKENDLKYLPRAMQSGRSFNCLHLVSVGTATYCQLPLADPRWPIGAFSAVASPSLVCFRDK